MAKDFKAFENEVHPNHVRSRLPHACKMRIVELFAQFQGLTAIKAIIFDEFGLDLSVRDIAHYDAGKPKARVGRRLREAYTLARQAWIERTADVGIAHQSQRLRLLEKLIDKAEKAKEFDVAIRGLKLAAEEMGGKLTNAQEIKHTGQIEHRHLSVEDAREELALRLAAHLESNTIDVTPKEVKLLNDKDNVDNLT